MALTLRRAVYSEKSDRKCGELIRVSARTRSHHHRIDARLAYVRCQTDTGLRPHQQLKKAKGLGPTDLERKDYSILLLIKFVKIA
jgi:hypothetical protein